MNWISVSENPPTIEDHCGVKESTLLLSRRDHGTPIVSFVNEAGEWFAYWGNERIGKQTHYVVLGQTWNEPVGDSSAPTKETK